MQLFLQPFIVLSQLLFVRTCQLVTGCLALASISLQCFTSLWALLEPRTILPISSLQPMRSKSITWISRLVIRTWSMGTLNMIVSSNCGFRVRFNTAVFFFSTRWPFCISQIFTYGSAQRNVMTTCTPCLRKKTRKLWNACVGSLYAASKPHPPSPFIIITHFTEGIRLSRPRWLLHTDIHHTTIFFNNKLTNATMGTILERHRIE